MKNFRPIVLVAAITGLIGCAKDETPQDTTRAVHELPSFAGTTDRIERADNGPMTTLHDVRTARHSDFVRVAFEFRERMPGYIVEYDAREPTDCGSGAPAAPAGKVFLSVRLFPSQAHAAPAANPEAMEATIHDRNRRVDLGALRGLRQTCDFEGVVMWVLGLDERRGYRVSTLTSPPRLVVDVQ